MKIIPLPHCPLPKYVLLERQLREEIDKLLSVPKHLLKPKNLSTAREILQVRRMK